MIDVVECELILSTLSKNSRQDTAEIWDYLRDHGYNLSEDDRDSRITKLEEERVISRYTISIDTKKVTRRIIRVALVRFNRSLNIFPSD